MDVKNGVNFVIVFYFVFCLYEKNNFIGFSDGVGSKDSGKLKVIIYNMFFENISVRVLCVCFG